MRLIPVKYHNKNYPESVIAKLDEIAGNLDSKQICVKKPYSLHTEYSYMKRTFTSELLDGLDEIKKSNKDGIPQLWRSIKWSEQYAIFIERLLGNSIPPEVIEIHPPFKEYCENIGIFWERYIVFYKYIISKFPSTKIIIENRCGTMYKGSGFLISTCSDVLELCQFLAKGHEELGIIVDYPQLFSAEKIKMDNVKLDKILQFNIKLKPYAKIIQAIHLWGKRKSNNSGKWTAHSGDLNTFFSNDNEKKAAFLDSMKYTFCDDIERYFVPEVNTSEDDLKSIVNDLISSGISFVQARYSEYLLSIDWTGQTPQFVMYNYVLKQIRRFDATGYFSFMIGPDKYCVGNKDINDHEFLGCPNHAKVIDGSNKCSDCNKNDLLKYCIRCRGDHCFVKRQDVLSRCNQEHYVYLAYFHNDVVKVGVAHNRRKYIRLFEQGALYSIIIASCSTGRSARELESNIRELGIRDRVTSSYKINNLAYFEPVYAYTKLMEKYNFIVENLNKINLEKIRLICPPEIVIQEKALNALAGFSIQSTRQLTLWDYMNAEDINETLLDVLDSLEGFQGKIKTFIGTIAVLEREGTHYLFDFKNVIGREMSIIKD